MIAAARVVVCKFSKPLCGLPPAIISSQVAPPLLHQIITSKVAPPHFSLTLLVVGIPKLFFSGLLLLLGQTHASRLKPRVASADHYRSCLLTIIDQPSFISFNRLHFSTARRKGKPLFQKILLVLFSNSVAARLIMDSSFPASPLIYSISN